MKANDKLSTPTTETLNNHVSIRQYADQRIPDEILSEILQAARRSPTSSNMQAYSFVVVRDPDTKRELARLAGGQRHIETCDVFIACCADVARLRRACELHGVELAQNTENTLVATVDAAITGMSLATAAESFGLGTVMIGGMRNHPREAAELLGFPPGVYVVYGMCLGYPAGYPDEVQRPPQKPRLPEELVIHYERYSQQDPADGIRDYDRRLAEHYRAQGRDTPDAAWSGVIAEKFSIPRREELRATLEAMGFSFD